MDKLLDFSKWMMHSKRACALADNAFRFPLSFFNSWNANADDQFYYTI